MTLPNQKTAGVLLLAVIATVALAVVQEMMRNMM